jgi:ribosome biogenesis GTPase
VRAEVSCLRGIGYPALFTSVETGEGLEKLRDALKGKLSLFAGKSGVGKSTLLNALSAAPGERGLELRTNTVSRASGKGRHTTSYLEMFDFEFGARIVDTPGLKYLTLARIESSELAEYMPEMRPYLGQCRFGADCTHDHEPGCAIKAAVAGGAIHARRYESYLRMRAGRVG